MECFGNKNKNKTKKTLFLILFANNLLCLSRSHMLGHEIHTWTSRRKLTLFLMGFILYLIATEKIAMERLSNPNKEVRRGNQISFDHCVNTNQRPPPGTHHFVSYVLVWVIVSLDCFSANSTNYHYCALNKRSKTLFTNPKTNKQTEEQITSLQVWWQNGIKGKFPI